MFDETLKLGILYTSSMELEDFGHRLSDNIKDSLQSLSGCQETCYILLHSCNMFPTNEGFERLELKCLYYVGVILCFLFQIFGIEGLRLKKLI